MPPMPGPDILDNVHGLAQAAWDVRQLLAHLRSTTSEPIGLMGLSLGGYTTALVGALDDDLACAIAIVPAVDLGALMSENRARVKHSEGSLPDDFGMLTRVMTPIAPLAMRPQVPTDRCFIVAGTLDQFAPGSTQAMALADHWGGADVHWFHGGHVSVFWAGGVQDAIDDALRRFGLVS
jgi:pimeloyl-ACP methyl ester carboxylesterase